MSNRTPLLEKFSAGLAVGIIFALSLAALFDSDVAEGVKSNLANLTAIIMAIAAAFFTLQGVRRQIEHQSELAEKARLASLTATKAFLPIALTEMCRIAQKGMVLRWGFYNRLKRGTPDDEIQHLQQQVTSELALSEHLISVFKDFIENATSDDGVRIALVLREYQIVLARWNGIFEGYKRGIYADATDEQTIHWAYLYALSSSAFEYSRNRASSITDTVGKEEISAALLRAVIIPANKNEFDTQIDEFLLDPRRQF